MDLDIQELERRKRYLKRYKKNVALIERLENKLLNLDDRIYNLKSPTFSDMPKGGGSSATMAELLTDKIELEKRINKLVEKGRILKVEILEKIDELDNPLLAEILESFFIDCKTIPDIAEDLGYSERHIARLYSEGIIKLDM